MNTSHNIAIQNIHKQYCRELYDDSGTLQHFEPIYGGHFNFAYDVVDAIAAVKPNHRALVWCNEQGSERIFTFAELKHYSDKAANLFKEYGIQKGDAVMLLLKSHYQFWIALLGLHKIGAVAVSSDSQVTAGDLLYRFQSAGVTHIVCTVEGDTAAAVENACEMYQEIRSHFIVNGHRDGWLPFDSLLTGQSPVWVREETAAEDPMLFCFTSGATGKPKVVWHDHTYPLGHILSAKHWHNLHPGSLHITVEDPSWAKSSWDKVYGPWFLGAAIFACEFNRFSPAKLLKNLAQYKVTSLCAPPTVYLSLVREGLTKYDLTSIACATTSGDALNAEVHHQFHNATGLQILESFDQTETTVVTVNLARSDCRPGSMGRPSPLYEVDLVNAQGHSVLAGEIGELVLRIPEGKKQIGLFRGYYHNDRKTAEVWHDGLYHTGDSAWRDENGYLWYVGPTEDVIKASGYRIGPCEIEHILMEHPAVLECAVTGSPDPLRGAVVKATIVLSKEYAPCDSLRRELQNHVKMQVAPYKYPRMVEFVEELPKTFSGKIKRGNIRRMDQHKQLSLCSSRRTATA